jgi:SAM-dependent methyltransferase
VTTLAIEDEYELLMPLIIPADMRQPLPFPGEIFDGLLTTRVIHHARLATVIKTAGEITRVLKPGGVLFLTVPAGKKSKGGSEEIEPHTFIPLAGFEKGLPHHIFSAEELRSLFSQFEVLDLSLREAREITLLAVKQAGSTQSN